MEFLFEYGLFLAKAITVVVAIAAVIGLAAGSAMKSKDGEKGELQITNLSERFAEMKRALQKELMSKDAFKKLEKDQKKAEKAQNKEKKKDKNSDKDESDDAKTRLFVIDFKGSIDANEVENLREEITAVLAIATKQDEVLIRLESGGGVVHGYGLASSQLARIRQREIPLTVAIDKVAASGGYMMASVANKIISAPFAIIGSIGVLAQVPNFNKLLKKNDIEFEQLTAGKYKRTLTLFGENTDEGREKFKEELEETHILFKQHIHTYRSALDVDNVATGEHWYGNQALDLGLIDHVETSDDYLVNTVEDKDVVQIKYVQKKSFAEKLPIGVAATADNIFMRIWQRIESLKVR